LNDRALVVLEFQLDRRRLTAGAIVFGESIGV
jgi:hypothetical protein